MKAILCSQYCQPDDLVLADVPDPVAEPGQAVIAIKSAALNFFDLLMIQGKYQIKPPFPFSPAAEVAGVIESVGAGVTSVKVGDRVGSMWIVTDGLKPGYTCRGCALGAARAIWPANAPQMRQARLFARELFQGLTEGWVPHSGPEWAKKSAVSSR